jgi:N-acetylmuramoyl-L-alanine amidase
MTRAATARNHISIRGLFLVAGIVAFAFTSFASRPSADKDSDPRYAFERAVRMRTQLEGYLPRDRSLANYKDTIAAYHKVYLLDPQAEEVTASLIAEAELYREMGRQFDPKYFQSAIDMYAFLLKQYPRTQYRASAIFAIGEIQQEDLDQTDLAVATYKDLLKRFPKSDKADAARAALKQISDAKLAQAQGKQATHL